MTYQIEEFNIISNENDFDLFFNDSYRDAVTTAINRLMRGKFRGVKPKDLNLRAYKSNVVLERKDSSFMCFLGEYSPLD